MNKSLKLYEITFKRIPTLMYVVAESLNGAYENALKNELMKKFIEENEIKIIQKIEDRIYAILSDSKSKNPRIFSITIIDKYDREKTCIVIADTFNEVIEYCKTLNVTNISESSETETEDYFILL
jgi:type IV secretory pathway VirB4 component